MTKWYMAIDPGTSNGLCIWSPGKSLDSIILSKVWLYRALEIHSTKLPEFVFIEAYDDRGGHRTPQTDAQDVIGAVDYVCKIVGVPLSRRKATDAKDYDDDWFKEVCGCLPFKDHALDACRHMVLGVATIGDKDLYKTLTSDLSELCE